MSRAIAALSYGLSLFRAGLVLGGLALVSSHAHAQQSACPAVNCDCAAIPDASGKAICESTEARIRQGCVANGGQPAEFCGIHGPAARPVALSIAKSLAEPLRTEGEAPSVNNLQVAHWALQQDAELIGPRIKAGELATASQMSQLLNRGQETLFQRQRLFAEAQGADLAATADRFTEEWRKLAELLLRHSRGLETTGNPGKLRAQLLRLTAEQYEMCGYWQARGGRYAQAAQWYKLAAGVAEDLAAAAQAEQAAAKIIDFYRAQASARWHRATLNYWQAPDAVAAREAREKAASLEAASP